MNATKEGVVNFPDSRSALRTPKALAPTNSWASVVKMFMLNLHAGVSQLPFFVHHLKK